MDGHWTRIIGATTAMPRQGTCSNASSIRAYATDGLRRLFPGGTDGLNNHSPWRRVQFVLALNLKNTTGRPHATWLALGALP
jgi:hypothetical protein